MTNGAVECGDDYGGELLVQEAVMSKEMLCFYAIGQAADEGAYLAERLRQLMRGVSEVGVQDVLSRNDLAENGLSLTWYELYGSRSVCILVLPLSSVSTKRCPTCSFE